MNVHRRAGNPGALVVVLTMAVVFAACDSDDWRRKGSPLVASSPFVGSAPFVGVTLAPSTIGFAPVPTFGCPLVAPFRSNFSIAVDQRTGSDIFLDQVSFRFVDGLGLPSPLQLTRSDLAGMFGSTLLPNLTTRTFQFKPQFGCGFVTQPSVVFINVLFVDRRGRDHEEHLSASLR